MAAYLEPGLFLVFEEVFLWLFSATMLALGVVLEPADMQDTLGHPRAILAGCTPGATASNVIVYLAGGALAYSIALTTLPTLLSPLLTPALVKLLGSARRPCPVPCSR